MIEQVINKYHRNPAGRLPLLDFWASYRAAMPAHLRIMSRRELAEQLTKLGYIVGRWNGKLHVAGLSAESPRRYELDRRGRLVLA